MTEEVLVAGTQLGPYSVIEPIGKGGMGYVYLAVETALNRKVAVKVVSESLRRDEVFIQRFQREAKTLARVMHPNIIAVYSMGEFAGIQYLALEYVDGLNVRQFIGAGQFFRGDLASIMLETTAGLMAIHQSGIVHRDIKLSNILLSKEGKVKIGDFGLAKQLGEADADVTKTGQLIGTVQYMAPELWATLTYTPKSDIFALGLSFYELICGNNPLKGKTEIETLERIRDVEIDFPEETRGLISWEMRSLIDAMVAKDPNARIGTMEEVQAKLVAALQSAGASEWERWPGSLKIENQKELEAALAEKGCRTPIERALVFESLFKKSGSNPQALVNTPVAEVLRCLQVIRADAGAAPALRESQAPTVQESHLDDLSDVVPALEEVHDPTGAHNSDELQSGLGGRGDVDQPVEIDVKVEEEKVDPVPPRIPTPPPVKLQVERPPPLRGKMPTAKKKDDGEEVTGAVEVVKTLVGDLFKKR